MNLYQQNPEFQLAEKICKTLHKAGFEALLAGGCVRDFLLKRTPNDFDVATSATPDQVESLFQKTIAVGKSFGVMIVVEADQQVEVATFRKDGPYQDGRRPASIEFSEAEEDAKRRDFTVNGLFYDLLAGRVVDYVGGVDDLNQKKIRAIGNPSQRFHEDHLRLLRAVRFSAQLGFEIESETWKAVQDCHALIATVSGERVQDEMSKFLLSPFLDQGFQLLFQSKLLEPLLGPGSLQWVSPAPIFSRKQGSKEDAWFRFFLWLRQIKGNSATLEFFENLCDRWKFSRDLKQKTLRALAWTYEKELFNNHPMGEVLAASFESEHLRGIEEYSHLYMQSSEKESFQKYQKRKSELGSQKPAPWVVSADLTGFLQGEKLGRALRESYWQQLEGKLKSKEEIMKGWKS